MHGKYSSNHKEDARTAEQPRTGAAGLLRRMGSSCTCGQLPPPSVKVPAGPGGLATPWRRPSSPLAPILPSTHCSPGLLVLASLSWPPCPSLPGLPSLPPWPPWLLSATASFASPLRPLGSLPDSPLGTKRNLFPLPASRAPCDWSHHIYPPLQYICRTLPLCSSFSWGVTSVLLPDSSPPRGPLDLPSTPTGGPSWMPHPCTGALLFFGLLAVQRASWWCLCSCVAFCIRTWPPGGRWNSNTPRACSTQGQAGLSRSGVIEQKAVTWPDVCRPVHIQNLLLQLMGRVGGVNSSVGQSDGWLKSQLCHPLVL